MKLVFLGDDAELSLSQKCCSFPPISLLRKQWWIPSQGFGSIYNVSWSCTKEWSIISPEKNNAKLNMPVRPNESTFTKGINFETNQVLPAGRNKNQMETSNESL